MSRPATGAAKPDMSDVDSLQREADKAFNGLRDFYIVWAICMLIREVRLLRAGVRP